MQKNQHIPMQILQVCPGLLKDGTSVTKYILDAGKLFSYRNERLLVPFHFFEIVNQQTNLDRVIVYEETHFRQVC